jgi:hypothetical protein
MTPIVIKTSKWQGFYQPQADQQKWQTPSLTLIRNRGDSNSHPPAKSQDKIQLIKPLTETAARKYRNQYNQK